MVKYILKAIFYGKTVCKFGGLEVTQDLHNTFPLKDNFFANDRKKQRSQQLLLSVITESVTKGIYILDS